MEQFFAILFELLLVFPAEAALTPQARQLSRRKRSVQMKTFLHQMCRTVKSVSDKNITDK